LVANTQSAIKRAKQSERRRLRNKAVKSRVRTAIRHFAAVIESGDMAKAEEALQRAYSELDRAARKGVIHRNKAARHKARMAKQLAARSA